MQKITARIGTAIHWEIEYILKGLKIPPQLLNYELFVAKHAMVLCSLDFDQKSSSYAE